MMNDEKKNPESSPSLPIPPTSPTPFSVVDKVELEVDGGQVVDVLDKLAVWTEEDRGWQRLAHMLHGQFLPTG